MAPSAGTPAQPADAAVEPQLQAYVDAGYDDADAVILARYWNTDAIRDVKLFTGQQLRTGTTPPIGPDATAATAPDAAAVGAYVHAGLDSTDAPVLAEIWGVDLSAADVKVKAGRRLLESAALPTQVPVSPRATGVTRAMALEAYVDSGYDASDAAELVRIWRVGSPLEAKVKAGERLIRSMALPSQVTHRLPDGSEPATITPAMALDAFYGAGYDYADAEELAGIWRVGSPYDAKIKAGKRLIQRLALPSQVAHQA